MWATMAAPAAGTAPAPSPSCSSSPCPKVAVPRRVLKAPPSLRAASSTATATSVSLLALFAAPGCGVREAKAFSFAKEEIMTSLSKVENAVDQAEDVFSKVLDVSLSVLKVIVDAFKPAVDGALPVLQKAGEETIKIGSPVVRGASNQVREALQDAGVDTSSVSSAFKILTNAAQQTTMVLESAKPIASSTMETISTDPSLIFTTGGALLLAYLLFPPVLSAVSFNFRGYKGNLTPAQALDLICTQDYLLIDIRSEKDKNKAGIPRFPSSAKNKMISLPLEELPNKTRSLVRDTKKVEAELVALKISYLKRVNKGSSIVIMDSYSDTAKLVAQALTSLGFRKCWIMDDGFSGRKGWLQSRLGTDSYNVSIADILSPSRVIPATIGRFGTTSSTSVQTSRKLLPGSIDG